VRLGRWLYYDKRLSADNTIACATCHIPEHAFTEPDPVSTGIRGQKGNRKAPTFINAAWALFPHTFWDGRAASLEAQAVGPMANPIEMGNTHEAMIQTLQGVKGYAKYFEESFGSPEITLDHVAKAIADYERTRMSGNSPYDRWKNGDESAVRRAVKLGDQLFFDKAGCNQCHLGYNFTTACSTISASAGSRDPAVQGPGPRRHNQPGERHRRLQDPHGARSDEAGSLHARRLGRDPSRSRRALRPRGRGEPLPRSEDQALASRWGRRPGGVMEALSGEGT
jgi:cytochrome c peroxidase